MSQSLEDIKLIAVTAIEEGHLEGKSEDDVKMDMFSKGVPFGKLNSLFKNISIELGHLVDPKVVTENLKQLIGDIPWADYEEWDQVESAINALADNVDGATPARALSLARSFCKEEEVVLPRKPKATSAGSGGGGRTSKLANAIVELVVSNPDATKQEAYDVVYPLTGGKNQHKNAMYYVNSVFSVAMAARKGITLVEAVKTLSEQPDPEGPEVADVDLEAEADAEEGVFE